MTEQSTQAREAELLPCPICKSSNVAAITHSTGDERNGYGNTYRVRCKDCGCMIEREDEKPKKPPYYAISNGKEQAIAAWNTRPLTAQAGEAKRGFRKVPAPPIIIEDSDYFDSPEYAEAVHAVSTPTPKASTPADLQKPAPMLMTQEWLDAKVASDPTDEAEASSRCEVPPKGWWCSRAPGHDGPCAARPVEEPAPSERELLRAFAFGDEVWPGIAKLAEECGEVVQVIGKLMMTHGSAAHWSGNLRTMLIEEMADVQAAVSFVSRYTLTEDEGHALYLRAAQKLVKFEGWHADMDADPPPPLEAASTIPEPALDLHTLTIAADTAYRVCAETRHVSLGDKVRAAIRALKGGA